MSNDPLKLDHAGEPAGLWWLPNDPEEKVPVILRYDPDHGFSLSLTGTFEDRIGSNPVSGVSVFHEGIRTGKEDLYRGTRTVASGD